MNVEQVVSARTVLTINLVFQRCKWMEDTESMNKLIKLYRTIFLLIKQIKNLGQRENFSWMLLSLRATCNVNNFRLIRRTIQNFVYGMVNNELTAFTDTKMK